MLALKTGVLWLQAKESQQPLEAGRGKVQTSPLEGNLHFSLVMLISNLRPPEWPENTFPLI